MTDLQWHIAQRLATLGETLDPTFNRDKDTGVITTTDIKLSHADTLMVRLDAGEYKVVSTDAPVITDAMVVEFAKYLRPQDVDFAGPRTTTGAASVPRPDVIQLHNLAPDATQR